jgi:hypothetical protein
MSEPFRIPLMATRSLAVDGWQESWEVVDFLFGGPHAPQEAGAWIDVHVTALGAHSWGELRERALEWLGRPLAPMPYPPPS